MRKFKLPRWLRDERGVTLVEVVVGMMILSVTLLGLAAAGGVAAQQVHDGRADMQLWAAVQEQVEDLMRLGYDSVTTGAGTVQGYPMIWTVTGTNPKQVEFIVVLYDPVEPERRKRRHGVKDQAIADTLTLYMANPNS